MSNRKVQVHKLPDSSEYYPLYRRVRAFNDIKTRNKQTARINVQYYKHIKAARATSLHRGK